MRVRAGRRLIRYLLGLGGRSSRAGVRHFRACVIIRRSCLGTGREFRHRHRARESGSVGSHRVRNSRRRAFDARLLPRGLAGGNRGTHRIRNLRAGCAANESRGGSRGRKRGRDLGGSLWLHVSGTFRHHPVDERLACCVQLHEAHRHAGTPAHRVHLGLHDDAFAAKQACPICKDELERQPGTFGLHGARGNEHAAARHVQAVLVDKLLLRRVREADAKREELGRCPAHFKGIRTSPPEP
ncbi:hypothetical protein SAMN04488504_104450 [Myxococcus virescens]|uniref:Uncharacterized protein n=1 Tax=Myxococcus virescens TaxID=83456 RepID=A0ABY0MPM3_9BACT|nr:hypothetical protein SAMN04488504_104450 [Myxococcus virescens]